MPQIGKPYELVSREQQFDPTTGYGTVETWQGNKTGILSVAAVYNAAGVRTSVTHKGPLYTLTARIGGLNDGSQPEVPQDQWEIETEMVQESVFASPKVLAAAGGSVLTLATWKNQIEDLLRQRPPGQLQGVVDPGEQGLYNLLARGQESHEVKRIVLSMVRTVSSTYAQQITLDAEEKVWTTAKLLTAFGVPGTVAARLPPNPSGAPTGTTWSWKLRRQTSRFILGTNKVQENRDWIFAAWANLTHTVIS